MMVNRLNSILSIVALLLSTFCVTVYAIDPPLENKFENISMGSSLSSPPLSLQLSEEQLIALNPCFTEKEEYSLLYGLLVLKSNLLYNIRMHGFYGSPNETFLIHPAISQAQGNYPPTSDWDSPQDYTSSLIQQLFPSRAHESLLIPGICGDLFRIMPVEIISSLLKLYNAEKKKHLSNPESESYNAFQEFLSDCFKKWPHRHDSIPSGGDEERWSLTIKQCLRLDSQWNNQLVNPIKTYADLFSNALKEHPKYPHNLIESTLLAFIWTRINLEAKAGKAEESLFDCLNILRNDQSWNDGIIPYEFSKNFYMSWKKKNLDQSGILTQRTLKTLLDKPEDLVYLALLYNLFEDSELDNNLSTQESNLFKAFFERVFEKSGSKRIQKLKQKEKFPENVSYKEIVTQASLSARKYSEESKLSTLFTLSWRKMCLEKIAKKTPSNFTILLCDNQFRDRYLNPSFFSKELYDSWKKNALDESGKIKPEALNTLLTNKEKLIYITLMCDVFDNPYPQLLCTGQAIYTYRDENGIEQKEIFSDCGEASLLNFLNVMICNSKLRSFNIDSLIHLFPNVHPKLITFYKTTQQKYENVNSGIINRSKWIDVTSNLNEKESPFQIIYDQAGGRCNIGGLGIDNMMLVLEKLLGVPFSHLFLEENDLDRRRAQKFTYLLQKFSFEKESCESNGEYFWYTEKNEEKTNDYLPNFAYVTIGKDGNDLFKWAFGPGHFSFGKCHLNQKADWRHLSADLLQNVLDSSLPKPLKSHLLPFYVNIYVGNNSEDLTLNEIAHRNNSILSLLKSKGYIKETLFGHNLDIPENKLEIMDNLLDIEPDVVSPLCIRWIQNMPDNIVINRALVCRMHRHPEFFTAEIMDKLGDTIKSRYSKTLSELEHDITCQLFDNLLNEDYYGYYSEALLDHLYETLSPSVLTHLVHSRNHKGQTPLHVVCRSNLINTTKWVKKFIEHGADINATDNYGKYPSSYASSSEIATLLLNFNKLNSYR